MCGIEYHSETDYTPRWETRTYDLAKLQGLDLFLSYWGPRAIAHTILSWQFEDSEPLAISIETRKEAGEEYSAVLGFFRQFELYYVVADERDLIRLRTNVRGEEVYLYRLRPPPARARALRLSYLAAVNRLATTPDWYNAFTHNCTTTIVLHIRDLGLPIVPHWKMFLNGYLDESLYEQGFINHSLVFNHLRERSAITSVARSLDPHAEFSKLIRTGDLERLNDGIGSLYAPEISPNGNRIVFTAETGGTQSIWLMRRDGSNPRPISRQEGEGWDPTWSPDNSKIAFASDRDGSVQLYIITTNGTNLRRVTRRVAGIGGRSDWSPDGESLVFYAGPQGDHDIFITGVDGKNLRQLTDGGDNLGPCFSPDGQWITFTSYRDGNNEIYMMRPDGSQVTRLTGRNEADYQPRWGP